MLFSVHSGNILSTPRKITAGVPQESSLSPILYILYLNDLSYGSMITTNIFADDMMFLYSSLSKHHAVNKLQQHLDNTIKWLTDWKISINPSKSVAVLFGKKSNLDMKPLIINNQSIEWITLIKYLGVKINPKLTFSQHIKEICNKARGIRAAPYLMLCYHSALPINTNFRIL